MRYVILGAVMVLAGCTGSGTLTPLDQGARGLGRLDYVDQGGRGTVTITMPDGEILNGTFTAASNVGISYGTATAFTPRGPITASGTTVYSGGAGNVWVSASGPRTVVTCQAQASGNHGGGICRTNAGATYQLMF